MDELMDALVDLYNSNESTDHDVFNGGDLTLKVESLACKYLISENGSCNWDNIKNYVIVDIVFIEETAIRLVGSSDAFV